MSADGAGEFNINEFVWVRVTQKGFEILRAHDAEWRAQFPRTKWDEAENVQAEQEAHGGWSRWQLWHLMQRFGSALGLGLDAPFVPTIRLSKLPSVGAVDPHADSTGTRSTRDSQSSCSDPIRPPSLSPNEPKRG
jgi:hypothetical protein